MARITITADDFGWSADTVRATIECLEAGVVTNASIMPGMPHTRDALEYAASHGEHCYGVHLVLAGDGEERPVSDPRDIPDLVGPAGRILAARIVRRRALLNAIPRTQIEREIRAQLGLVAGAGIRIAYVDSHKHIHKIPSVRQALANVLSEFGINRVRRIQNIFLTSAYTRATYWLGGLASRQIGKRFRTTDLFYMPTHVGDDDWDERLPTRVADSRTLEVGMHPGFDDGWRGAEMRAVTRFVQRVRNEHPIGDWASIAP
jgi:predicted glycoside hydrolase/deacetylase ChbG (UPF0249 family)